ncbi:hypothetical protein BpHYR1_025742 [Brachionus plicatilis]|uniref:Uncharacterized protein n=1 Tax=Brachionus plicatilis TaxID=10195 RepID=A0A3M7QJ97_BRAPC|nr:hypothetical protein BpHYR1_025742 [Brachionus plicatilis]
MVGNIKYFIAQKILEKSKNVKILQKNILICFLSEEALARHIKNSLNKNQTSLKEKINSKLLFSQYHSYPKKSRLVQIQGIISEKKIRNVFIMNNISKLNTE